MIRVAITRDDDGEKGSWCLAVAGSTQAEGRTAGEALDALNAQLGKSQTGTLVILQAFQADDAFSEQQQQRLSALMSKWREARDAGGGLSADGQRELEALIDAEVKAAGQRAESLGRKLRP